MRFAVEPTPEPSSIRGPPRTRSASTVFTTWVMGGQLLYEVNKEDLPTFRFGNGQKDQAVSRVDLQSLSFYVLGGSAGRTPPLVRARTLRSKDVIISYSDGLFRYRESADIGQMAVQMKALASGHLTIDLSETPKDTTLLASEAPEPCREHVESSVGLVGEQLQINMMVCEHDKPKLAERLQLLTSRLNAIRETQLPSEHERAHPRDRPGPSPPGLPMLRKPQAGEATPEPARGLDHMCPLRPSSSVLVQEGITRQRSAVCGDPPPAQRNPGGGGEDDPGKQLYGENGGWKDDGVEGQDVAGRADVHQGHDRHLCGVSGCHEQGHGSEPYDHSLEGSSPIASPDDLHVGRGGERGTSSSAGDGRESGRRGCPPDGDPGPGCFGAEEHGGEDQRGHGRAQVEQSKAKTEWNFGRGS